MASDDFRLALIGTGNISKRHVSAMADLKSKGLDDFVVTAVCDINEMSAEAAAASLEERLGLRPAIYTDYEELLTTEEIDGADICLPHGYHHSVGIDCMDAGVHVLCEKPLGITIRASQKMAEAADRTGCILSTAVPMRRTPSQRVARWALNESGLIGTPLAFFHHCAGPLRRLAPDQPIPPRWIWRQDRLQSGGRHIIDSGFHYHDSMRFLLGDVEKVYARVSSLASGRPEPLGETEEDAAFVVFTLKSGVVGTWSLGLTVPGETSADVVFYGSKGSLRDTNPGPARIFHLFHGSGTLAPSGQLTREDGTQISLAELERMYLDELSEEEKQHLFPNRVLDGFSLEIWEFIEAARGRRETVEVDGWEGLRTLAVAEAIYESAFTDDVVRVDDVLSGTRRAYQEPIDAHWGL
jgi:UDP-N-acetyl-2-amino-2-deoxyglucuronate dehydrogenase